MVQPWYYGKGQEIRLTIDSQPAKLKCSHQFGKKKKIEVYVWLAYFLSTYFTLQLIFATIPTNIYLNL